MKTFKVDKYLYNNWTNRVSDPYVMDTNVNLETFIEISPFDPTREAEYYDFRDRKYVCFKFRGALNPSEHRYCIFNIVGDGGWYYKELYKLKACFKLVERADIKFEFED